MNKPRAASPPTPEEFQKQLSDFLRQHFRSVPRASAAEPEAASSGSDPEDKADEDERFKFDYKPRQIKEHLDRFVIRQEEAKKVLSVALCDHYHHVRLALEGKE